MPCINHLYIRELLINCSSPFFLSTGFTNFDIAITTTAIITITNVVISGSIIKIVTEIANATTDSVNIPKTVVSNAYVAGTSDCTTLSISPDSAFRKNS